MLFGRLDRLIQNCQSCQRDRIIYTLRSWSRLIGLSQIPTSPGLIDSQQRKLKFSISADSPRSPKLGLLFISLMATKRNLRVERFLAKQHSLRVLGISYWGVRSFLLFLLSSTRAVAEFPFRRLTDFSIVRPERHLKTAL